MNRRKSPRGLLCAAAMLLGPCLISRTATGQIVLKSSEDENVNMRLGFQGQFWGDWNQSNETGGYAQNVYLRRIRLLLGGQVAKDVTFFFQTDDPNLGKTPKALGSGFLVQDAFMEWKVSNAFRLDGGLMLVPFSRNTMQSTLSYYTLDINPITTVSNTSTESSGLRDAGFQARGFFLNDHLLYRAGLFAGERQTNAENSLRTAGYVQYDFFSPEKDYTFVGTALGKKKILALSGGFDRQSKYRSMSSGLAGDLPVFGGDEIGGQVQYIHYDGRTTFTAIPDQNDTMVEATYYVHRLKVQPFARFDTQNFVLSTETAKDIDRYGGGVNYYVHAQNLKFTLQYLRADPRNSLTLKPSNELTVQLQVFYF